MALLRSAGKFSEAFPPLSVTLLPLLMGRPHPSLDGSPQLCPPFGLQRFQKSRKGGFSKRGFCRVQRHAQETKQCQEHWAQPYVWHSERHSQERRNFLQKTLQKNHFLVPEGWQHHENLYPFAVFVLHGD